MTLESNSYRLTSIDLLRGIIMVIMALDHTRDYFHTDAFVFDPTNLEKTNTVLFFTRWITHYCMPTFVLLAGVAIHLSLARKSKKELSWFLLTRGLWMVLLEFTVMRFAFLFNFYYDVTLLSVLWLFGSCMMMLSLIIYLSDRTLLAIALLILVAHDLSVLVDVNPASGWFPLWTILFRIGFLPVTPSLAFVVSYPVIPWLGVMLLGYSIGKWYSPSIDSQQRKTWLRQTGWTFIVAFVVLRFVNLYGDPAAWSVQKNAWFTFLSFINTSKYPVSLLFLLMTLGPLLLALSYFDGREFRWSKPFVIFGRVPLFYFIGHFFLIHSVALILFMQKTGKTWDEIDLHFAKSFGGITPEGGYTLPWVYVAWVAVVLAMYPLCAWYAGIKRKSNSSWLSYL